MFFRKLDERIEKAGDDIPLVSDVMRYFFHFVKCTCTYVVEYNANLRLINELVKEKTVIQIISESKKKYEQSHRGVVIQRFQSYLIMPIQRIPRYVLLLKDLLKNVPPLSQDADNLLECYHTILDVAAWINKKKQNEEEREKYQIVMNCITEFIDLNKSCRRFILSGHCEYVDVYSTTGLGEAYFFLFNDVLIQTKIVKHHGKSLKNKPTDQAYRTVNEYKTVENFDEDLFQSQQVYCIDEQASVQYLANPTFGPSISLSSSISCSDITLVFNSQIDANAWFVALAYCIHLSPQMNESKNIFNKNNESFD